MILGKEPKCSDKDWREKGAKEIEAIANYTIQKEITEDKAARLLQAFSAAFQNEVNGDLTIAQLKEKLLTDVTPQVLQAFNAKLRPWSDT